MTHYLRHRLPQYLCQSALVSQIQRATEPLYQNARVPESLSARVPQYRSATVSQCHSARVTKVGLLLLHLRKAKVFFEILCSKSDYHRFVNHANISS